MSIEPEQLEENKRLLQPSDTESTSAAAALSSTVYQDPMLGKTIDGKYLILERLGQGGMSAVYKAEHVLMKRMVAVKVMHAHLKTDPLSVKRFEQESWTSGSLKHPNLVTVHDSGKTEDGSLYLVMDHIEGHSLDDELSKHGRLAHMRACKIFLQAADGLEMVHQNGIIHRDIKPSNIMISDLPDGSEIVRIVDFGIAKVVDESGDLMQKLTQTGQVFGSPLYMSPEQCQGIPLDKRSDIYALGCVMYEAICGEPPLVGVNPLETMKRHIFDIPPSFNQVDSNLRVPVRLEALVFKMMEKDPAKRYQDLAEFKQDLKDVIENNVPAVTTVPDKIAQLNREFARRFRPKQTTVLITIVCLLSVSLAWVWGYPFFLSNMFEHDYRLGKKYFKEANYQKAEIALVKAESWAKKMNDHDASLSRNLELLANVYKKLGKYLEMEEVRNAQQKIVETQLEGRYGLARDELQQMVNTALLQAPARTEENTDAYEEAIYKLSATAAVCTQHNQLDNAEKLMRKAISLCESSCGRAAPGRSSLYGSLARICVRKKNYEEAEEFYRKQLDSATQSPGPRKEALIIAECNMVRVCTAKKEFEEAEKFALKALKTAERETGNNSTFVKTCLEDYAALCRAKGDNRKAAELDSRASMIMETSHGSI
ncbi:MAG: serine/threonine-protein kinase [Candidatus Obscuribacterales bacterium]|nr:serine/threonine-protein kinase [Candidatus Obscuribacterales bacterium]